MTGRRVAAAIIAGGRGERLGGRMKAGLVVGGRRIIERQVAVLRPLFPRLFVVGQPEDLWKHLGLEIVSDRAPTGSGPLSGIDAALSALASDDDAVVCIGGDMPFLIAPALELLRDAHPDADALVPLVGGFPEPIFARYGRGCAHVVAAAIAEGRLKTSGFLAEVRTIWLEESRLRAIDPELGFLDNVNTPQDLARARARAGE